MERYIELGLRLPRGEWQLRTLSIDAQGTPSLLDADLAWSLLVALAARARAGRPVCRATGFSHEGVAWEEAPLSRSRLVVDPDAPSGLRGEGNVSASARTLFELFLPLVVGPRSLRLTVGHLGQSLDGRVATPTGASQFITGREDVVHTHRLRALFDAVVVGVRTVLYDNPQLTTRLVSGEHPTRVILDPQARLEGSFRVLEDDVAPTLICTRPERLPRETRRGHVSWVGVRASEEGFEADEVLEALRARGLGRVFIEGGGITISRFLSARALDRLHVSVAPMILGSGAPAFALPPIDRLDEALTPRCRHFTLGRDILFDCELVQPVSAAAE